jgi:hypothetical protein
MKEEDEDFDDLATVESELGSVRMRPPMRRQESDGGQGGMIDVTGVTLKAPRKLGQSIEGPLSGM